ncbi:hypothetical protein LIER_39627 [Lithospermum erythrorhizon]|uniref:Di19 C-terminal domain-containing protein n=1 Tax=Lithospermum erythrorhizon TaxID=34254 RepID=A0AAV3QJ83_LITER
MKGFAGHFILSIYIDLMDQTQLLVIDTDFIIEVGAIDLCRNLGTSTPPPHSYSSWFHRLLPNPKGNLQHLLEGTSLTSSPKPNPLLSSSMFNVAGVDVSPSMQPSTFAKEYLAVESFVETLQKIKVDQPPVSEKDQEEKFRKCKFVIFN